MPSRASRTGNHRRRSTDDFFILVFEDTTIKNHLLLNFGRKKMAVLDIMDSPIQPRKKKVKKTFDFFLDCIRILQYRLFQLEQFFFLKRKHGG